MNFKFNIYILINNNTKIITSVRIEIPFINPPLIELIFRDLCHLETNLSLIEISSKLESVSLSLENLGL